MMITPEKDWYDLDNGVQARTVRETERFVVTEILGPGSQHVALKTAANTAAEQDLGNYVGWTQFIGDQNPQTFSVPRVIAHLDSHGGSLFSRSARIDWIDGSHPAEDQLANYIPQFVDTFAEMASMEVAWRNSPEWWIKRRRASKLDGVLDVLQTSSPGLADKLSTILAPSAVSDLRAGVSQGDFNPPQNTIITPDGGLALLDGDYATHGNRPDYVVPHMYDAAYLYHLLRCQYEQTGTAESLLQALAEKFNEDPAWHKSFWVSSAERTLSMLGNFVITQHSPNPTIDERRKNPDNYTALLSDAIDALSAA